MTKACLRGFSLTELAIVLAVVGVIVAGVWQVASSSRENARLHESLDDISLLTDAVRSTFVAQGNIPAAEAQLTPTLAAANALPPSLLQPSSIACAYTYNGTTACLQNPWGDNSALALCPWNLGVSTKCAATVGAAVPYFAVEFSGLGNGACIELAEGVSISAPAGLLDVYVNAVSMSANGGLPPTSTEAVAACNKGIAANTVDLVYKLH